MLVMLREGFKKKKKSREFSLTPRPPPRGGKVGNLFMIFYRYQTVNFVLFFGEKRLKKGYKSCSFTLCICCLFPPTIFSPFTNLFLGKKGVYNLNISCFIKWQHSLLNLTGSLESHPNSKWWCMCVLPYAHQY